MLEQIIKKAKREKDILAIALFGSSIQGEGRDIDICIFLNKKKSNLEMSKKRLEFLKSAKKDIDIQIFQQLPLYIRIRILREGKILFYRDSAGLYELAFDTIKEFGFFEKAYNLYLEGVKNGQKKNIIQN